MSDLDSSFSTTFTESEGSQQNNRLLTPLLLISLGLNGALLLSLFYLAYFKKDAVLQYDAKPTHMHEQQDLLVDTPSNRQILHAFHDMTFAQLVATLTDEQLVEDGYCKRDLALAALVAFHYFDLEKALPGQTLQQRSMLFELPQVQISIFPGLTEMQYQAVIEYAKTERWPFKNKGLFVLLQKQSNNWDESLAKAFFLTQGFLSVKTLCHTAGQNMEDRFILQMILEGTWELLENFYQSQRQAHDMSETRRQQLLLDYIAHGSKTAAYLLLEIDFIFAVKRLDDKQVMLMFELLTESNALVQHFAKEILLSLRSDVVLQKAAEKLYYFSKEEMPQPWNHMQALARFIPEEILLQHVALQKEVVLKQQKSTSVAASQKEKKKEGVAKAALVVVPKPLVPKQQEGRSLLRFFKKDRIHIVEKGDNLWKISRMYRVDLQRLQKYNDLSNDARLQLGQRIKIPQE